MQTRKGVAVHYSPEQIASRSAVATKKRSVLIWILRSYKNTPHGPSIYKDKLADPHKIKFLRHRADNYYYYVRRHLILFYMCGANCG